jgi:hypothetical protein
MGQNNDPREKGDAQGHQGGQKEHAQEPQRQQQSRDDKKPGLPEENIAHDREEQANRDSGDKLGDAPG